MALRAEICIGDRTVIVLVLTKSDDAIDADKEKCKCIDIVIDFIYIFNYSNKRECHQSSVSRTSFIIIMSHEIFVRLTTGVDVGRIFFHAKLLGSF